MWTVYQGKLQTQEFEDSSPKNDEANFLALIQDLNSKLRDIVDASRITKEGSYPNFKLDEHGQLVLYSGTNTSTSITFTPKGYIQVDAPGM